jgi:hypothetical protein
MKIKYKSQKIDAEKKSLVDIFIRSYPGDFEWLGYCLKSIKKYCSGFRDIILTITEDNVDLAKNSKFLDLSDIKLIPCKKYPIDDYIGQMITKSKCHEFSNADVFCHIDSDCFFYNKYNASEIFEKNKIIYFYNLYKDVGDAIIWKNPVERFLGFFVDKEFMRSFPMCFSRDTYKGIHDYCLEKHNKNLEGWVVDQFQKYNRLCYIEFNTIGAYAFNFQNDKYRFIESPKPFFRPRFLKQYWSWGGISDEIRKEIEYYLA